MSAPPDVDGFCRRWRDSNGHVFTLERIEFDTERGGGRLVLHGTSSNCTCQKRGLQSYCHDGPYILYADNAQHLATGLLFGFEAEPNSQSDVARFVEYLLGLTEHQWAHISRILDGEEDDFAGWVPGEVCGAVWALNRLPVPQAQPPPDTTGYTAVHTLRDMLLAGHTDTTLIAAALLAGLTPTEAAALDPQMAPAERSLLIEQLMFLPALRAGR